MLELFKSKIFNLTPFFLPSFADRLNCNQRYSSHKAISELNYKITPFSAGLIKTVNHFKQNLIWKS